MPSTTSRVVSMALASSTVITPSLPTFSLASVTPSLVTVGEPHDFSMITFRPRGPRVTLTVLARVLSPLAMAWRAAVENTISLAAIVPVPFGSLFDDGEDVVLAQDEVLG